MRRSLPLAALAGIWSAFGAAAAQGVFRPPVRPLGPVVAASRATFAAIEEVRQLADGHVLVNDVSQRLIVNLDSSLAKQRLVMDSAASAPNSYGSAAGFLFGGAGDTSLFVDFQSRAMVSIDRNGQPVGTAAMPPLRTNPLERLVPSVAPSIVYNEFVTGATGVPAMSAQLGLVYSQRWLRALPIDGSATDTTFMTVPDSAVVVAMNARTRAVDTLAAIATGVIGAVVVPPGRRAASSNKPLPLMLTSGDGWAVMTDGSIAILHGQQYRLSWIGATGRSESKPISYPWKRLSDDDKQRAVDSADAANAQRYAANLAKMREDSAAGRLYGRCRAVPGSCVPGQPQGPITITAPPPYDVNLLPDYISPFIPGRRALMPDGDNNLWIRVGRPDATEVAPVYDVVNRNGELVDRVRLPEGRELIGFGPGGTVYLIAHDGGKELLERARVK